MDEHIWENELKRFHSRNSPETAALHILHELYKSLDLNSLGIAIISFAGILHKALEFSKCHRTLD